MEPFGLRCTRGQHSYFSAGGKRRQCQFHSESKRASWISGRTFHIKRRSTYFSHGRGNRNHGDPKPRTGENHRRRLLAGELHFQHRPFCDRQPRQRTLLQFPRPRHIDAGVCGFCHRHLRSGSESVVRLQRARQRRCEQRGDRSALGCVFAGHNSGSIRWRRPLGYNDLVFIGRCSVILKSKSQF